MPINNTAFMTADEFERKDYLRRAREIAELLVFANGKATVDDVRSLAPLKGLDPSILTGVFPRSLYKVSGYVNSTRATAKSRAIAEFTFAL